MSHSTVLVIGPTNDDELTAALEPFDENASVLPYDREPAPYLLDAAAKDGVDLTDLAAVAKWASEDGEEEWHVKDGHLYYRSTYNPQSKWDWWQLGGRWAGALLLKPGVAPLPNATGDALFWMLAETTPYTPPGRVDRAAWGTIDWERMAHEAIEEARAAYRQLTSDASTATLYGIDPGMTEDEYARNAIPFCTFAILTPQGEWLERGDMGWFGIARDEKDRDSWISEWHATCDRHCTETTVVSIVDVHI